MNPIESTSMLVCVRGCVREEVVNKMTRRKLKPSHLLTHTHKTHQARELASSVSLRTKPKFGLCLSGSYIKDLV